MSRLKLMLIAASLAALSACGTPGRPVLVQAFPAPPVDLKSPLPKATTLPKAAKLSDVMAAHLADDHALADATAEITAWRIWWTNQSTCWTSKACR